MKFLCVPCDRPMKLHSVAPPDRGSLSVVYTCPDCGYEIAMLTNPYETQLVQSLGVRVGPAEEAAGAGASRAPAATAEAATSASSEGPKCPFASMVPSMEGAFEGSPESRAGSDEPIRWTSAAEARLANIPSFVRGMARTGIEKFAREKGCAEVDETILDAARDFFGM